MTDVYKNPETEPQSRELESRLNDHADWGGSRMNIASPAGSTILVNGNEKGILESDLFEAMQGSQTSPLGSGHSAHKQGIYSGD